MQKILLTFSLILVVGASKAGTVVAKYNEGPYGWDKITETHDAGSNTLVCSNPGYAACTWVVAPTIVTSASNYKIEDIDADVQGRIRMNILEGTYLLDNEYSVSWRGQDLSNYTFEIASVSEK